ncbi:hypothetical protein KC19_11G069700 [Ceratodon purpureus]|uniref:Uncharacterized protein n=1 Tax=Ceratodon purpureus TaxID=3225 RepID=A0A8T0GFQ6_CERPU|nr:hypothetical protein KC19_11G069700 [Ceratodon purpureus]
MPAMWPGKEFAKPRRWHTGSQAVPIPPANESVFTPLITVCEHHNRPMFHANLQSSAKLKRVQLGRNLLPISNRLHQRLRLLHINDYMEVGAAGQYWSKEAQLSELFHVDRSLNVAHI